MAGEAGATGGGMSPGAMGTLGVIGLLGGTAMDYIGQRRGAKAMDAEAERQLAEQEAFGRERQARLIAELGRFDPNTQTNLATDNMQRSMTATQPSLAAGGKALGMGAGQVTSAGRALMPMQRVAAQQGAQQTEGNRAGRALYQMQRDQGQIQDRANMAAQLYDQQLGMAGNKGAMLRTGGSALSSAGLPMLVGAMNRAPAQPPPGPSSGINANAFDQTVQMYAPPQRPANYVQRYPG